MYEWNQIPWRKLEKSVHKLQKRIYRASLAEDVAKVKQLQKLLLKSWGAKCIAVRRVTQDNQGKKTAGVDGVKSLSPEQRLKLVDKINLGSKAAPVRRVWIPKPGKEEKRCSAVLDGAFKHLNQVQVSAPWLSPMSDCIKKRPLGIPTMYDRALQCLVKLALEPEWEARFEPNSYGFRPGRSCQDAVEAIFNAIRIKPKYVLDADISQCFDRIDHEKLLTKINTFPTLRKQIRAWLKAGVWDNGKAFPTSEGGNGGYIQKD